MKKDGFINPVSNQRGVSLVVVLWVVALLMAIAAEFVYTVRVESSAVMNFRDESSAEFLALAGINAGVAEVARKYDYVALDNDGEVVFLSNSEERDKPSRRFGLGNGEVEYRIEDEAGKLNLNSASRDMLFSFLKASGVEEPERSVIADSIADWKDENHEHHLNGAEDDFYQSLQRPYGAKDGNFDTVEELLLVKGVTPKVFNGSKAEAAVGGPAGDEIDDFKSIKDDLTVHGPGRININTAAEKVLTAFLGEGKAQEVILKRRSEGYMRIPYNGGIVSSLVFKVRSKGTVNGLSVVISAVIEKSDNGVRVAYWNEEGIAGLD